MFSNSSNLILQPFPTQIDLQKEDPLNDLPSKLILEILKKLSLEDLKSFASTSKRNYSCVYGAKTKESQVLLYNLIIMKITQGQTERVKEILQKTVVNPADKDNKAFKLASFYGNVEVVKELLQDERVIHVQLQSLELLSLRVEPFPDRHLEQLVAVLVQDAEPLVGSGHHLLDLDVHLKLLFLA